MLARFHYFVRIATLILPMAMFAPMTAFANLSLLQSVMEKKELRICIWPDYYSITYRNPKTRQLSGINIDIAEALGRELGIHVRYIDSSFSLLGEHLLTGQCDIAMQGVAITPERLGKLSFTQPYLRGDLYAVTKKNGTPIRQWDDLDQPGRVIAVQQGSMMEYVMKRSLKYAKLLTLASTLSRDNEVESGRADAFITDYPYSRRVLEMSDWAQLISPPRTFHTIDYAYALAPGDPSLLNRLNQFISLIKKDGRLQKFARKYKLDPILIKDAGGEMTDEQSR